MPEPSKRSIEQYYAEFAEADRLTSGMGQLEFERTKRISQRFLPPPPAIVVDVGGGTGPYSFWLAELGYETHLTASDRCGGLANSRTVPNICPQTNGGWVLERRVAESPAPVFWLAG
jgi:hypothetical protein